VGANLSGHAPGVKRQVLLTILRSDMTPTQIGEFKALAAYQARAAHPHVTAVYEAGECNGRYYYAKELWSREVWKK